MSGFRHALLRTGRLLRRWSVGLCLLTIVVACTQVSEPDPYFPKSGILPTLIDTLHGRDSLYLDLKGKIDQTVPYVLTVPDLRHGAIRTSATGLSVVYANFDIASGWQVDSSNYKVCYGTDCRQGKLYIYR